MTDQTPQWNPPTPEQLECSREFLEFIFATVKDGQGIHIETAIASAARMAGTFLFRSFGYKQIKGKPGMAVLSDEANQKGPLLMRTLELALMNMKVELDQGKLSEKPLEENQPHWTILETHEKLEDGLNQIAQKHNLDLVQAAHACALTAAQIIQIAQQSFDPNIGFKIAVYSLVEGSKTLPRDLAGK